VQSRKDQMRYLFGETSDSERSSKGSLNGDEPTREQRKTELLEVLKKVVSESLKGTKLIHGPDAPGKQYPFLMQGAINEKASIATGAHTFKTLAKYLFAVKETRKLFLDVVKFAAQEDKLDIRCWLELALFCNLCPQAEKSSYYIARALDRLVPAVVRHDRIYEDYTKEKMTSVLSNKVTLYDNEETIEKARKLFGLLEGGDEQHDDEPSDGARSDGVEEEKQEEEAAAANAAAEAPAKTAAFRLTFHNLPFKPQVTDASGQACILRASMQQQGFEEAPPPVQEQELAEFVTNAFSDIPMSCLLKGGNTPSSTCDTGTGGNGGNGGNGSSSSSTSEESGAGNNTEETQELMLLHDYVRQQKTSKRLTESVEEVSSRTSAMTPEEAQEVADAQAAENAAYNTWAEQQKEEEVYPTFQATPEAKEDASGREKNDEPDTTRRPRNLMTFDNAMQAYLNSFCSPGSSKVFRTNMPHLIVRSAADVDGILYILERSESVQAAALNGCGKFFRNDHMQRLIRLLKHGGIWALNLGEIHHNVTSETWWSFLEAIPHTRLCHLYIEPGDLCMKGLSARWFQEALGKNRKLLQYAPRCYSVLGDPENAEVIKKVHGLLTWWGPLNAKVNASIARAKKASADAQVQKKRKRYQER